MHPKYLKMPQKNRKKNRKSAQKAPKHAPAAHLMRAPVRMLALFRAVINRHASRAYKGSAQNAAMPARLFFFPRRPLI
jgi:hypothetical protein